MIFSLILAGLAIVYLLSLLWTGYKGFYPISREDSRLCSRYLNVEASSA